MPRLRPRSGSLVETWLSGRWGYSQRTQAGARCAARMRQHGSNFFQIRHQQPMLRRHSFGARKCGSLVYVLLGALAITTFVSMVGFNVDLAIASLFYDPATRHFIAHKNQLLASLRDHGMIAVWTCVGVVALGLVGLSAMAAAQRCQVRTALFLTLSLLLGPGLLVNGILKPQWGRPRPIHVTQFGGNCPLSNGGIQPVPASATVRSCPARSRPRPGCSVPP